MLQLVSICSSSGCILKTHLPADTHLGLFLYLRPLDYSRVISLISRAIRPCNGFLSLYNVCMLRNAWKCFSVRVSLWLCPLFLLSNSEATAGFISGFHLFILCTGVLMFGYWQSTMSRSYNWGTIFIYAVLCSEFFEWDEGVRVALVLVNVDVIQNNARWVYADIPEHLWSLSTSACLILNITFFTMTLVVLWTCEIHHKGKHALVDCVDVKTKASTFHIPMCECSSDIWAAE